MKDNDSRKSTINQRVSKRLGEHYDQTFAKHGANSKGADWGDDESRLELRYQKMLALIATGEASRSGAKQGLLDVGCGYGGLLSYAQEQQLDIDYTGIDLSTNMITWANDNLAGQGKFLVGDILTQTIAQRYDYVVCNGILTQKLDIPGAEMDEFARNLIHRLFELCNKGIAFNVMTTRVNYFANNLYYKNPAEMIAWCMNEVSPHFVIDHSYPLYEYTVYLYRESR